MAPIDTGSDTPLRMQDPSHKRSVGQTRAQISAMLVAVPSTAAASRKRPFRGQQHPFRDGIAQGAAGHTARVRALDAAAGLLAGSGLIIEAVDFEEIGDPFRSRALGQALVGQLAPGVLGIRMLRDRVAHRVTHEVHACLSHGLAA